MREYKGLMIPPRHPRNLDNIEDKRQNYCLKTKCKGLKFKHCEECLFSASNIEVFKEWYMLKNKRG